MSRRTRIARASAGLLVAAFAAGVCASMPSTVLTPDWRGRHFLGMVLPESWEFFTRDPQSPSLILLHGDGAASFDRVDSLPQTRPENLLGLSRNQRSQDTEKVILADQVSAWTDCGGALPTACVREAKAGPEVRVRGAQRHPSFCGQYVIAEQRTTPFNYRDLTSQESQLTKAAFVRIDCQ